MSLVDLVSTKPVKVRNVTGLTDAGEPTFGTAYDAVARVVDDRKLTMTLKGEERQSASRVFLPPGYTVNDGCQISTDGGQTYRDAMLVKRPTDVAGVLDHYEVIL